jgi:hypothetical protein
MTDDARTGDELMQKLVAEGEKALKNGGKPAEAFPWATTDALVQIGYTEPSGYVLDLPPIGVRRGGIRFPRIHMNHTVKRLGWRRWFVQARFDGDDTTHRFGPFTSEKKAKVAQGELVQFHRTLDYLHTYKPGSST